MLYSPVGSQLSVVFALILSNISILIYSFDMNQYRIQSNHYNSKAKLTSNLHKIKCNIFCSEESIDNYKGISANSNNDIDEIRNNELQKYLKRNKRRNEMPLSQKWYKNKQQHLSKNQKRALNTLWQIYGIHLNYKSFIHEKINNNNNYPIILDIGFGSGNSTYNMAKNPINKEKIIIGCEIHKAGIANLLLTINNTFIEENNKINNIRIIRCDVTLLFENYIIDDYINEICVYFPDPWPNYERDGVLKLII